MEQNYLQNYQNPKALNDEQIMNIFNERAAQLENISMQLADLRNKAAISEQKVKSARDVDFRHWYGNDTTKAVEYLQSACIALSDSQISTKKALELMFDYQRTAAIMVNHLISACNNDRDHINKLQAHIKKYLETQNKRNDKVDGVMVNVLPSIQGLQERLEQDNQRLAEMEIMQHKIETLEAQAVNQNSTGVSGSSGVTIATIVAGVAVVISIAVALGFKI